MKNISNHLFQFVALIGGLSLSACSDSCTPIGDEKLAVEKIWPIIEKRISSFRPDWTGKIKIENVEVVKFDLPRMTFDHPDRRYLDLTLMLPCGEKVSSTAMIGKCGGILNLTPLRLDMACPGLNLEKS